jgi:uncharacterized protein (DUF362 family)
LDQFDRLLYLVSAKTHHAAGASLSLKMSIGLMHPAQRMELHADHLVERIAEASLAARPDLAIVDARRCFVTGGPAEGEVRFPGVMLAGADLESLDEAALEVLAAYEAVGLGAARRQVEVARALS